MRTVSRSQSTKPPRYSTQTLLEALEPRQLLSGFTPTVLYPNSVPATPGTTDSNAPAITTLPNGNYILAWQAPESLLINGDQTSIFAQLFLADGRKLGPEILVNTQTEGMQVYPDIAALENGSFVISWSTYWSKDGNNGVYAQVFDATAQPLGSEILVHATPDNYGEMASVTSLGNGGFAIAWTQEVLGVMDSKTYIEIFDPQGNTVKDAFLADQDVHRFSAPALIARNGDAGFFVAWNENDNLIAGQSFDNDGQFLSSQITLAESESAHLYQPRLAALNGGALGLTWLDIHAEEGRGVDRVMVQTFSLDADGAASLNAQFEPFAPNADLGVSDIAPLPDGGYLVMAFSDPYPSGFIGQRYDADSNPVGEAFTFNQSNRDFQNEFTVSALSEDQALIIWNDYGGKYEPYYYLQSTRIGLTPGQSADPTLPTLPPIDSIPPIVLEPVLVPQPLYPNDIAQDPASQFDAQHPKFTALPDGGYLLTWTGAQEPTTVEGKYSRGIFSQRYDADDQKAGDVIHVNIQTDGDQSSFAVATLDDGGFVITWSTDGSSDNTDGIYAQRFDAQANRVGDATQVTDDQDAKPAITRLGTGGYVIAWSHGAYEDFKIGSGPDIYARLFDSSGLALGESFVLNQSQTTGVQDAPVLTATGDSGFVAVWSSRSHPTRGDEARLMAQAFDNEGRPLADASNVQTLDAYGYAVPTQAITLTDGSIVIAWDHQYGSNIGWVLAIGYEPVYSSYFNVLTVDAAGSVWGLEKSGFLDYTGRTVSSTAIVALPEGGFFAAVSQYSQISGQLYDAKGQPVGVEHRLTNATNDGQGQPTMALLADGQLITGWYRAPISGTFGSPGSIFFQRHELLAQEQAGSTPVPLFPNDPLVNPSDPANATMPALTHFADGSYILTWAQKAAHGSLDTDFGIYAQRYSADGTALGSSVLINTGTNGNQGCPDISILDDQTVVITWLTFEGNESVQPGIFAQHLTRTLTPISGEIQVSSKTFNSYTLPKVTALDSGFVITWTAGDLDNLARQNMDVYAQVFNTAGQRTRTQIKVNRDGGTTVNESPTIARNGDEGFVVVWSSPADGGTQLVAQAMSNTGAFIGAPRVIDTGHGLIEGNPSITPLSNGSFALAWTGRTYSNTDVIRIDPLPQRPEDFYLPYGPNDAVLSWNINTSPDDDFQGTKTYVQVVCVDETGVRPVSQVTEHSHITTNRLEEPVVTALADGGFVVASRAYFRRGTYYDILGQRFDSHGEKVGEVFWVNRLTDGTQTLPAFTQVKAGELLAVWSDNTNTSQGTPQLRFQRFGFVPGVDAPYSVSALDPEFPQDENWNGPGSQNPEMPEIPSADVDLNLFAIYANDITYTDRTGNTVRITLTGPGTLTGWFDDSDFTKVNLYNLQATGTNAGKSSLNVTVTKNKGSSGVATIVDIDIDGGLTSLTGQKLNVAGDLTIDGNVGSIKLGDIVGQTQHKINIHNTSGNTSISLGHVNDASIEVDAGISAFSALDWIDSNAALFPDQLKTHALGTLTIQGNFGAGLWVSAENLQSHSTDKIGPAIKNIQIRGNSTGAWELGSLSVPNVIVTGNVSGHWDLQGKAGNITIAGNTDGFFLTVGQSLGALTVRGQFNAGGAYVSGPAGTLNLRKADGAHFTFTKSLSTFHVQGAVSDTILSVDGTLGNVNTGSWTGQGIGAGAIGSIFIRGDFTQASISAGNVNLNTGPSGALRRLVITGDLDKAGIFTTGPVGQIMIGTAHESIIQTGILSSLIAQGDVTTLTVESTSIGSISTRAWNAGSIKATTLGSLTTRGGTGSNGDFSGFVEVHNLGGTAVGSINIFGSLLDTTIWIVGNINRFSAGSIVRSSVLVELGSLNTVRVHGSVDYGTISCYYGDIDSMAFGQLNGSQIQARKVNSIVVRGDAVESSIYLVQLQEDPSDRRALGSLSVGGAFSSSSLWTDGNVNSVALGSATDSTIHIGLTPRMNVNFPTQDKHFAYLLPGTGIRSTLGVFTISGKGVDSGQDSFVRSIVAAGTINNVSLKSVRNDPADEINGISALKVGRYLRLSRDGDFRAGNITTAGLRDPINTVGEHGFVLKIVDIHSPTNPELIQ